MLAGTLELNSVDRLRLAIVYARHARLVRDVSTFPIAKENLERCKAYISEEIFSNWCIFVLTQYALVDEAEDLWHGVIMMANDSMAFAPCSSYYALTIANAHLGDRFSAENHLAKAISIDGKLLGIALRDPDMRPLWEGAGSPYYAGRIPKSHIH